MAERETNKNYVEYFTSVETFRGDGLYSNEFHIDLLLRNSMFSIEHRRREVGRLHASVVVWKMVYAQRMRATLSAETLLGNIR
jgi:hypothetical protein